MVRTPFTSTLRNVDGSSYGTTDAHVVEATGGLASRFGGHMKPRGALLLFTLLIAFVSAGCATKPSTQWWRVGNCLVLYDQTKEEKQVVAVGQGCDIKRDTITATGDIQK